MFRLSASIVSVLQPLACLFTAPTTAHLHVLLTGTVVAQEPRTVTAALPVPSKQACEAAGQRHRAVVPLIIGIVSLVALDEATALGAARSSSGAR